MRKLLLTFGFIALVLISPSYLYGCGGGGGESNPDSDMFGDLILGTLKMNSFTPENQDYIAGSTVDIGLPAGTIDEVLTEISMKDMSMKEGLTKEQQKKELQKKMAWNEKLAQKQISSSNLNDAAVKTGTGAGVVAGLTFGALSGALEVSGGAAIAIGAGYSATTTAAGDIAEGKSAKAVLSDSAKAAIQSAAIGAALPNDPIKGGVIDTALSAVDASKKTATYGGTRPDYGSNSKTLANGVKVMK